MNPKELSMTATPPWLDDAVFYEIYPQSFYDSNGDGIGDLPGIIEKLDYIQSLGVTALWLNPCFVSPFQDAGYDVSDYYRIAPRYGTNEDARRLFAAARQRGIRVLLDLVAGHTSIEHPWFRASCQHERNEYSDWYIWTDSAWTWDVPGLRLINGYAQRDATYVTNFFYSQPALNYGFANPDPRYPWQQSVDAPGPQAVRREMVKIMRAWLDMGCSGFRVDMASSLVKADPGWRETKKLWLEVRAWLDQEYPEAVLVAEWSNPTAAIAGGYHMDFLIHFGSRGYNALLRKPHGTGPGVDPYGFSFFDSAGHGNIMEFLDDYMAHYRNTKGQGQICLVTGNHDIVPRLSMNRATADLELCFLFLLTMPGVPYIYYGDEIGLRTIVGLPSKEGGYQRTWVRTPMQWTEGLNAGFSPAPADRLYLPVDAAPDRPTVAAQDGDAQSLLNRVRRLVALRHTHPALRASGEWEILYADRGKYPLVYRRSQGDEMIVVALNPAGYPVSVDLPAHALPRAPQTLYGLPSPFQRTADGWRLQMPGVSGGVYGLGRGSSAG
jgi:glycosidase